MVAALIIFAGMLIAGATHTSVGTVEESWREISAVNEERAGTDYAVISATVAPGDAVVDLVVRNEGRTTMREPQHMDVIASYDGIDTQRWSTWLPFSDIALDNTWNITGITNDYANPGYFDPGEEMTVQVRLAPAAIAGNRWLVVATDTGLSYTIYF
jgi:hypothetical protein